MKIKFKHNEHVLSPIIHLNVKMKLKDGDVIERMITFDVCSIYRTRFPAEKMRADIQYVLDELIEFSDGNPPIAYEFDAWGENHQIEGLSTVDVADLMGDAIVELKKKFILDATTNGYKRLREDDDAWKAEQEEQAIWSGNPIHPC